MKKRIIGIIAVVLCTFTFTKVNAIEKPENKGCKVSEEWIKWAEMSEEKRKEYLQPEYCESNGLEDYHIFTEENSSPLTRYEKATSYPSYYRASSTAVKNQNVTPTCWAFATTTILESHLLKQLNYRYTFSPQHINYMESQSFYNISSNTLGENRQAKDGGNFEMSLVYFMNHYGPVYEATVPTDNQSDPLPNISSTNIIGQKNIFSVNDMEAVYRSTAGACTTTEKDHIKKMITTYGPTGASLWYEEKYLNGGTGKGGIYMYNGSESGTNHSVTIVGWDDNYAASNFSNNTYRPSSNGAWIVQNSHGTDHNNNGIFYVSYEDKHICRHIFDIRDVDWDIEDNKYTSAQQSPMIELDTSYPTMRVFQKQGPSDELLTKVSFRTLGPTSYQVYYYAGNAATAGVGTDKMKLIASGSVDYKGAVTAKITGSIVIPASLKEYSIAVVQSAGTVYNKRCNQVKKDGSIITVCSKESFPANSSYIGAGSNWYDFTTIWEDDYYKAIINAFTKNVYTKVASATVNYTYQDYFNVTAKVSAQASGKITNVSLIRNGTTYAEVNPNQTVSSGGTYTLVLKKSGLSNFINGTYQIQITQENGIATYGSVNINVQPITAIGITNVRNQQIGVGKTMQLNAVITPANHNSTNPTLTWTSSNPDVATVSSTGLVTGKKVGKATITVKTTNNHATKYEVTVSNLITSITLNPTSVNLNVGGTKTIGVTIQPTNTTESKTVTWTSSNTKVATVDSTGKITAKGPGTATIKASVSKGRITKTIPVSVNGVTLNKTSASIEVFKTLKLTATVTTPKSTDSKTVTWTSSNTAVATVNSSGLITAKTAGTTTITAKDFAGRTAKATITVTKVNASKFSVNAIPDKTYTGKVIKPKIVVKYNGKTLKAGTDYTVKYSNNKKVGKATVKITANSKSKYYTGSKTVNFVITPKKITVQKLTTKSKTVRVYWKKHPNVTKYKIEYRIKGTTKWTGIYVEGPADSPGYYHDITGLTKGKIYQVRVRGYVTVDGKDHHGVFSKAKNIKCK